MKNELTIMHDVAMEFVDEAGFALKRGDINMAKLFYQKAYLLEQKFALAIPKDTKFQLSRSIFIRSAATLAFNSGFYKEAEKLATLGLSTSPHLAIKKELEEVLSNTLDVQKKKHSKISHITGKIMGVDVPAKTVKLLLNNKQQYFEVVATEEKIHEIVKLFWGSSVEIEGETTEKGVFLLGKIRGIA